MAKETTLTEKLTSTREGMRLWHQSRVIFAITERLCQLMNEQKVSPLLLSIRLGKPIRYAVNLPDGKNDMTIAEVSDAFLALGRELVINDVPHRE